MADDPPKQSGDATKIHPIVEFFHKEWRVVKSPSFWISVGIVTIGLFWVFAWHYSGAIAEKDSTIQRMETDRDSYKDKFDDSQKNNEQLRNENAKYQSAHNEKALPYNGITSVRFFFSDPNNYPESTNMKNIYRWFTLKHVIVENRTETNSVITNDRKTISVSVFLVFDNPVNPEASQLHVSINSTRTPIYEVKDFSQRSAIIVISDDMSAGGIVDISVEKK